MSSEKSDAGQEALPETNPATQNDIANHGGEAEQSTTTTGQTKCSICQSTFRRPEHLKRHFRSHTKEKPFECMQCGRHFSRTDTLHRHELSHHTVGTEGGKDRTHRITVKTFRACFKCAAARVRCSGGAPCSRCESRSLECQYPTERRSKAKLQKAGGQNSSPEKANMPFGQPSHLFSAVSTAGPELSVHKKVGENSTSQLPGFQIGQFQLQVPRPKDSASPSNSFSELNSQDLVKQRLDNGASASITTESSSSLLRTAANGATDVIPRSVPSFSEGNKQFYRHIANSPAQNDFIIDRRARSSNQSRGPQPDIRHPDHIPDISTPENQLQLTFTQPFLDQSTLSTINWLSNDLFLDPVNDQGLVSGPSSHPFQAAVFDNSLARTSWLPPVIDAEHTDSSIPGNLSQTPSGTTSIGCGRESPTQFARDSQISQSQSESIKRASDYHANEPNRRPPKFPRKQKSWPMQPTDSINTLLHLYSDDRYPPYSFPGPQEFNVSSSTESFVQCHIKSSVYNQIHNSFIQLCCTQNFLYPEFESHNFPSAEVLSQLLKFYFSSFQPVYPMFHPPTFDPNRCHWLVVVALAAIGSHSASPRPQDGTTSAFHEFLRRALHVEKEKCRSGLTPLWLLQALMLNCIGILHGSDERGIASALGDFGYLVNLANRERLICRPDKLTVVSPDTSLEQQWTKWIEDETRRRTGYLIWLVDCTIAYHFDSKPLFALDDGQAPLPSHEKFWNVDSAQAWKELRGEVSGPGPSLYDAVLIMYIEKGLVPGMGDFSHILLIHALYHRMWEVGDYFRRPLSFWNPTAKKQSRHLAIPSGSVWLPGIPSYSKWRNSACDCLDILHWTADSTVAKATGHEHPTVLHLHTARIVLLAPFREIRSLATSLATEKVSWGDRQQIIEWHYILRWIKHDQYKARLAVVHAGSVLWHVRRYPTSAFHEPVATFLAILTLWAYGMCYAHSSVDTASRLQHDTSSDLTVIPLDQPCDDELVQIFVRGGQSMKAILSGVGDIRAPHGPDGILRVGCETISNLHSWEISKRFVAILVNLAELAS